MVFFTVVDLVVVKKCPVVGHGVATPVEIPTLHGSIQKGLAPAH